VLLILTVPKSTRGSNRFAAGSVPSPFNKSVSLPNTLPNIISESVKFCTEVGLKVIMNDVVSFAGISKFVDSTEKGSSRPINDTDCGTLKLLNTITDSVEIESIVVGEKFTSRSSNAKCN
jgi:hypothetical protein